MAATPRARQSRQRILEGQNQQSGLGSVRCGLSFWKGEFAEDTGKCSDPGTGRTDPGAPCSRVHSALPPLRPSLAVNGLSPKSKEVASPRLLPGHVLSIECSRLDAQEA